MFTKDFSYLLPNELIAKEPLSNREDSRLLHLHRDTGEAHDKTFLDLLSYLHKGDLLIVNNTMVMNARLYGTKESGGQVEILVERIINDAQGAALVHIRASKSPRVGSYIYLSHDTDVQKIRVLVESKNQQHGLYNVKFEHCTDNAVHPISSLTNILQEIGKVPIPRYFDRAAKGADKIRYQTVYAKNMGSVAAPTAGLHFSNPLLFCLQSMGVAIGQLTLHIGAGTFQPIRVNDISQHKMHSEYLEISAALCEQIKHTKATGGRVICVGSTVIRALEAVAYQNNQTVCPYKGETDIFITPGFNFNVADGLLTNFHLPESTLLVLVCAFAGTQNTLNAYKKAIAQSYRFFSYGDAMLILGDHQ